MSTIKTHPVKSSQIEAIGHDPHTNTLAITFKSRDKKTGLVKLETYHYANVTAYDYQQLKNAESIGSHFHKFFKPHADRFPYTKQT